jgi:multicomponent K+:H+ antiporter subunit D
MTGAGPLSLLVAPIALPLAAGVLLLFVERASPRMADAVSLAAAAALAILSAVLLRDADRGGIGVYLLGNWPAPFGIALALDRLAALLLAVTAGLAVVSLVVACSGCVDRGPHFHPFFQFQLAGLNGAFLTADLFNLFVFFELLLVASYGLLLHGAGSRTLKTGYHYVVVNLAGSALFLIAASLVYGLAGTLNFADLAQRFAVVAAPDRGLVHAAILLLLAVFAIKAAVLPFGFWLPATYAAAPAPVAALFAVMTKVGIYAIVRTTTVLADADDGEVGREAGGWLFAGGIATIIAGALGAVAAGRLKSLAASLVVVSSGVLVAAVALGNSGVLAGALYYLVHSTFAAALLFLLVEPIARLRGATGDRLRSAAPMAHATPLGLAFVVAAMAVAGLPPLSGFIGKLFLLDATYGQPHFAWYWAALLASGLVATVALARAGSRIFWKAQAATGPAATRIVGAEVLAIGALLCVLAVLAFDARSVERYARATAAQLDQPAAYVTAVLGARPVAGPREGAPR